MHYENRQQDSSADRTIQLKGSNGKSLPAVPVLQRVVKEGKNIFGALDYYYSSLDPEKKRFKTKEEAQVLDDQLQAIFNVNHGIPNEMKQQDGASSVIFGGPNTLIGPGNNAAFDTPPNSPSNHEHGFREEVLDEQTLQSGLVLNFTDKRGKGDFTTRDSYTLNHKDIGGKAWVQTDYPVAREDRHDARFSAMAFNETAKMTAGEKLQATALSEKEKEAKKSFLTHVNKSNNNGTTMHEPDQPFLPQGNSAREKGGSFMGIHKGTKTANSMMGQFLHFNNPQYNQSIKGASNVLVKEQDGKVYRYHNRGLEMEDEQEMGINNAHAEQEKEEDKFQQMGMEVQDDNDFEEQNYELDQFQRLQFNQALIDEGWSVSEAKDFFWDMVDEAPKSLRAARKIFMYYYINFNIGPVQKAYDVNDKIIQLYIAGEISVKQFKKSLVAIEDESHM